MKLIKFKFFSNHLSRNKLSINSPKKANSDTLLEKIEELEKRFYEQSQENKQLKEEIKQLKVKEDWHRNNLVIISSLKSNQNSKILFTISKNLCVIVKAIDGWIDG